MRDYQKLARYLDTLRPDPEARVGYDLFAGGLVWSDEYPPHGSVDEFNVRELRAIWNYRSSLILGNPREKYRPAWEAAQQSFPNWPGFDPQRRDRSWAETLKEQEAKAMKEFGELDERSRASQAMKPQKQLFEKLTDTAI